MTLQAAIKTHRRILLLIYPGFELLDLSGPVSVFSTANQASEQPHYDIRVISVGGGPVSSDSSVTVDSENLDNINIKSSDTLLVTGGNREFLPAAMLHPKHQALLLQAATDAERWGSVCTGTFLLAATGLLDDRSATTHWGGCKALTKQFPEIRLDADALYVQDGKLWTSAGVSTGIDMSLAMVSQDLGSRIMGKVARSLVVYSHRPGNQSQFSGLLNSQMVHHKDFSELLIWLDNRLERSIRVEEMANRVGMSERSFHRKFTAALGLTPAKYVEVQRLERAREFLEAGQAIKAVAGRVGFRSEAAFRKAFQTRYGLTPSMHRRMHKVPSEQTTLS